MEAVHLGGPLLQLGYPFRHFGNIWSGAILRLVIVSCINAMGSAIKNAIWSALLGLLVAAASATELVARAGLPAPDFTLTDQYDHSFKLSSARGQTVLLVSGDRQGNQFMGNWSKPVREKYNRDSSTRVRIIPIANLEAVPGIFHGFVTGRFRGTADNGRPKAPVLLDWDGIIARQYGFRSALTNVYLIDPDGVLQFMAAGEGSRDDLTSLLVAIDRVLKGGVAVPSDKREEAETAKHGQ